MRACFLPITSSSAPGGGTLIVCPHLAGASHCMVHWGLGQVGLEHFHSQAGVGHTVWHPKSLCPQSTLHLGFSQWVVHFGVTQSRVLRPWQGSGGQYIAQLGSPHRTLHPAKAPCRRFGHWVWHDGTPHSGLQCCSHTGSVQFHTQCGTQLFLSTSGTSVGCGVVVGATHAAGAPGASVVVVALELFPAGGGAGVVPLPSTTPTRLACWTSSWTAAATAPWGRWWTLMPRVGL
mmetsp:Transcript_32467/g.77997  ORF Transcript_32467/g.77997 Transcript_32467/m.77997 type:complete len:233 (-) Transcript_32467:273-971(-)